MDANSIRNILRDLGGKTLQLPGAKQEKEDTAAREARILLYQNRVEYNEIAAKNGLPMVDLFTGESRKI